MNGKIYKNGYTHTIFLWSYRGPKESDQTGPKCLWPHEKGIQMKSIFFKYLIAMLSTSLLGGIWYSQMFSEIVNGLYIQRGWPCPHEAGGFISHCWRVSKVPFGFLSSPYVCTDHSKPPHSWTLRNPQRVIFNKIKLKYVLL